MSNNLVYFLEGKPYINITNSCTNACLFCIRNIKDDVQGANLLLEKDDAKAQNVIKEIEKVKDKIGDEIVFCGYGEPLIKLEEVKKTAKYLKDNFKGIKIRINTNGHANLIFKRNIAKELKGLIDSISVSLNAQNKELYDEICAPKIENAYEGMKEFACNCAKEGIQTTMSVVTGYKNFNIDAEECNKIAESLGCAFRERPWIENGYN